MSHAATGEDRAKLSGNDAGEVMVKASLDLETISGGYARNFGVLLEGGVGELNL